MADITNVFRSFVFVAVLALCLGQFGFPGMGFGGRPGFAGGRGFAGRPGGFAGRPGFFAAGGGGRGVGGRGFGGLMSLIPPPPQPTTTTPRPTFAPLDPKQSKLAGMLAKMIYTNHKLHDQQLKKKEANMTPLERRDKKVNAIVNAAKQFNLTH